MRDAPEVDWVVAAPVVLMVVLGGFGAFGITIFAV
jgi:hypothetical protein